MRSADHIDVLTQKSRALFAVRQEQQEQHVAPLRWVLQAQVAQTLMGWGCAGVSGSRCTSQKRTGRISVR